MSAEYDTLTHRIFCETISRLTNNDDNTAERCYISSNEYLSDYLTMDLTEKRIATVGSSGDQFFVALLNNCKDITIIDANPYTKMFVEYKKALFKNLTFEEMNKIIKNSNLFSWKIYAKISHSLPITAKQFWDTLMLEQNNYHPALDQFDQNTIALRLTHSEAVFFSNFYNDEESYLKLQKILRDNDYKLKFKTAYLQDFPKELKGNYDLILLSNIYDYQATGEDFVKFEQTVEKLYRRKLNPGGSIQVRYSYSKHWNALGVDEIAGHKLRICEIEKGREIRTAYFIDKPALENTIEI